jgi:hypothetical protein
MMMMKRLAFLMILAGLSGASLADEPAFCKSMCASEKTQCVAGIAALEKKEAMLSGDVVDQNPYARAAQVHARAGGDNRALVRSGDQYRRETRAGGCDTSFQRCTRGCTVPEQGGAVDTVVSRHARKAG